MKTFAIVYQNGIANVFDVTHAGDMPEIAPFTDERKYFNKSRVRLLQHAFAPCEWFMRGAVAAGGVRPLIFHCDVLGDCATRDWKPGIGRKFADKKSYA